MQDHHPSAGADGRTEHVATWRTRFATRLDRAANRPDPELDELVGPGRWFTGGEPTLRADLPELISASPGAGLVTDGLALQSPAALSMLRRRGLTAARIQLHSARPDAHDWLMGRKGTARGALKAIRACAAAGLELEVEAVVTRPTSAQLSETVELVERLGVRQMVVRRLERTGPAALDFVALSPRMGLTAGHLDKARAVASRLGVQLDVRGFDGPDDADVFGAPATITETFRFTDEPSRELRVRLVRIAELQRTLRVVGHADHPAAADLLRDCTRLFDRVDATLVGSTDAWSDRDRRQLKGLASLETG
ncbi:MAG: radical SAM protein [Proteobacteria bacterium]|nr:radical SAM protein [Pseudomonadota bacterium]